MVTGRRPFDGEDITDTIAAVVSKEPDWSRVPVPVSRLLQQCLQKDPRRRLRDIGDLARGMGCITMRSHARRLLTADM